MTIRTFFFSISPEKHTFHLLQKPGELDWLCTEKLAPLRITIIKPLWCFSDHLSLAPWLCVSLGWLSQRIGDLLSRWKSHMEHYFWPQSTGVPSLSLTLSLKCLLWALKWIMMMKNLNPASFFVFFFQERAETEGSVQVWRPIKRGHDIWFSMD